MPSVHIIGTRGYPSYYGGFETAVRHLVPYLVSNGWETLVYSRPGMTKQIPEVDTIEGVSKMTYGIDNFRFSTLSYGLSSIIATAKSKPDIALIMNVANCIWLPILKFRKIPTVVNVDGIEWNRAKWGPIARSLFILGSKITAKHADAIITDAEALKKYWERGFKVNSTYIPYGATLEKNLTWPPNLERAKFVLYVARFVPENSISEFIKAVPKLTEYANVVIVGSDDGTGKFDSQIVDLCDSNSKVHWMGRIEDDRLLNQLWYHCSLYIHGHTVGGTNPALVQAMGCGAVVIAHDNVFNRETLSSNGLFFTESEELVNMAKSILDSEQDRIRISSQNKKRAKTHFNWERVNSAYMELLSATLRSKSQIR